MIYEGVFWRFPHQITRRHLRNLSEIREMTIPEPLFGSFVENALPFLQPNTPDGLPVIDIPLKNKSAAHA